jgi:hypothetical protein
MWSCLLALEKWRSIALWSASKRDLELKCMSNDFSSLLSSFVSRAGFGNYQAIFEYGHSLIISCDVKRVRPLGLIISL